MAIFFDSFKKKIYLIESIKCHEPVKNLQTVFALTLKIGRNAINQNPKGMNKEGAGFQYLKTNFHRISDAKFK